MKLAFADTETTGVDPSRHFAWEIAVILRDPDVSTHDTEHSWLLKPDLRTADPMALRVGRFYERTANLRPPGTREKCDKWSDPAKAAGELALMLDGATLVAHNPHFDAAFISKLLRQFGHVLTCDYHYTDAGSLLTGFLRGKGEDVPSAKLDALCNAVGLDVNRYERHSALGDARLVRDAWNLVMGQ